ncbi:chromate transporter [Porphyromonas loveana]
MIFLQLFWVYIKIGLFGFGGGYAMLSLIQDEVVHRYGWITAQEFTDIVAISQMTPGPIGINSATYIGYTVTGSVWGSVVATVAVSLPSFVLVLILSAFFARFRRNAYVDAAFRVIRPATVGLIASAALSLMFYPAFLTVLLASPEKGLTLDQVIVRENFVDLWSVLLFAFAFLATVRRWLHPIVTILIAGLAGLLIYGF